MTFSGIGKLIKELVTGTPTDTDYFIFGNSDMKKITLPNLKKALGIDELNSNMYSKNPETLKGLETFAEDVKPGHYTISDGLSKEKGWPVNDTETLVATLLVIGRLNNASTMQGYRVYLLFTNKTQFFVLAQWWEKDFVRADNWKKVTLNAIS